MSKLLSDEELQRVLKASHKLYAYVDGVKVPLFENELDEYQIKYLMELIQSQKQAHADMISGGDMHELLMAYGKVCEEESLLSPRAVTIRMDIATYFNELEQRQRNNPNGDKS